jgi:alkylation response protein AidB-like acyl-CoA dehydrogenase
MATLTAVPKTKILGGGFLLAEQHPADVFTPEDFTEQHTMIGRTTDEFVTNEILPLIERQEEKEWPVVRDLLKKAGDLGLSGVEVPEAYGGLEMDKVTSAVIADRIAKYAGFCTTWGAHTGIGLLPLVYFGTDAQKKKYLPRLAAGEIVAAYALSEATSGSDALNCRARAVLSPDGKHYILNGEKMWITNAGFADLFTVFAKVDGEKFTAFLVERNFPGFSHGGEEIKMGIRGSSTCPIIMNDCPVPVENVLGEIGKGATIAFNILNIGRFKLGAMCVGGARASVEHAVSYAKERKAFGKVIADFGLVREKIANMALNIYVGESMVYRTVAMLDALLSDIDKTSPTAEKETRKAIEEYAVECSIIKVWASEMVAYAVDETVQIYGGYGFVEEYPAARAYRDARINRIFEGTNEINRLIITGFLLKRAMGGQLPLMPAIKKIMDEVLGGPSMGDEIEGPLAEERKMVANAKKLGLFVAGAATQKYMAAIQDKQEVMGAISDMTIEVYAMESALLRAQKIVEAKGEAAAALPIAMTRVYLMVALTKLEACARKVIADVAEGDMLRTQMAIVRRLAKHEMLNTIALRQQIAQATIDKGKYTLV